MIETNEKAILDEVNLESRTTKKERIVSLFKSGTTNLEELAKVTDSSLSYVGSVLQEAKLMTGYFDLYTTTANPMNVYSKLFVNKLGFRDETAARRSVEELERVYRDLEQRRDRAGQHHALEMALIMFDRARWTGKYNEAAIFRKWLISHLDVPMDQGILNFDKADSVKEDADQVLA